MKIAICGKGGSGKSVVTTLLAKSLVQQGKKEWVVDSDESNASLYLMLGFESPPTPLMEQVGGKKSVQDKLKSAMTSENSGGGMSILQQEELRIDDIPADYLQNDNGLNLVAVGKIQQSLEGCACPMGVLSREFLKKLSLEDNEVLLVDMEAGIEHFGRGLETSLDAVLTVVEPSKESLLLAGKIKELCEQSEIASYAALINKSPSEDISEQIKKELEDQGIRVLGSIPQDQEIFKRSLSGESINAEKLPPGMQEIVRSLF